MQTQKRKHDKLEIKNELKNNKKRGLAIAFPRSSFYVFFHETAPFIIFSNLLFSIQDKILRQVRELTLLCFFVILGVTI